MKHMGSLKVLIEVPPSPFIEPWRAIRARENISYSLIDCDWRRRKNAFAPNRYIK